MKKQWNVFAVAVAVAAVGLVLLDQHSAEAQKKGKSRAAQTKYLMQGINQPNCAGLAKSLGKDGSIEDKAWETAVQQASLLNEMGYLLMDDGRCPSGDWAGACKTLKESSAAVLTAAEDKDADAARAAFKTLTGACAKCHKAHKKG